MEAEQSGENAQPHPCCEGWQAFQRSTGQMWPRDHLIKRAWPSDQKQKPVCCSGQWTDATLDSALCLLLPSEHKTPVSVWPPWSAPAVEFPLETRGPWSSLIGPLVRTVTWDKATMETSAGNHHQEGPGGVSGPSPAWHGCRNGVLISDQHPEAPPCMSRSLCPSGPGGQGSGQRGAVAGLKANKIYPGGLGTCTCHSLLDRVV